MGNIFEPENLYILTDETGNFQRQEIEKKSYIVAALVYLENNKKADKLSKFLNTVYNLIKNSIDNRKEKVHYASVKRGSVQEEITKYIHDNIDILKENVLTFYVNANKFKENTKLKGISPMHLYLYILKALAKHIPPVSLYLVKNKRNIKSVLVNLENLQFIGIYGRLLDKDLMYKAKEYCEKVDNYFVEEDDRVKDFVKHLPDNIEKLLNFGNSLEGKSNKIDYAQTFISSLENEIKTKIEKRNDKKLSLLADFYASLFKMPWLKDIKKELDSNLFELSGDSFNYKGSNDKTSLDISLQINDIFGFHIQSGRFYIKDYDNDRHRQINLDGFQGTKFEAFIKDIFNKENVNSGILLGLDTDLDKSLLKRLLEEYKNETPFKENNLQIRRILDLYPYMLELLLLNNIGVVDNGKLSKYISKMPKLYIDKFYNNTTPKHIYNIIFRVLDHEFNSKDSLDQDEYLQFITPIESLDKYNLIKYFLYTNILYSAGTLKPSKIILDDIKNKIEELESEIPKAVIDLLDYDSTHNELNKYYRSGEFDKLKEFIDNNIDNIKEKIMSSSGIFKRRYLTTLAAILSEMYEGIAAFKLLNYIINDLSKKANIESELYRTKGALAELYARFGMYKKAYDIYCDENLKELKHYEEQRTISQMIPIMILRGYEENDKRLLNTAKDYADYVLWFFNSRYEYNLSGLEDVLYALFNYVAFDVGELKTKYVELDIENRSETLDPKSYAQLPLAIILIALGRTEEALRRLIEANFIIEAYDVINSSIGKDYKSRYLKIIDEKLNNFKYNKGVRRLSEDVLQALLKEADQSIDVPTHITSQDKFLEELKKPRQKLITYRTNVLNYLRS